MKSYIPFYFFLQDRELNDETLLTRQRAVRSLCDHLHDPEHIVEALRVGKIQIKIQQENNEFLLALPV